MCCTFCWHDQLSQRENEVSALSGQLSSELEKMQEDAGRKEEMTQLLQHANNDIVRTVTCTCTCTPYTCNMCISCVCCWVCWGEVSGFLSFASWLVFYTHVYMYVTIPWHLGFCIKTCSDLQQLHPCMYLLYEHLYMVH